MQQKKARGRHARNEKVLRFFKDADILIHDTQYTLEEYKAGKQGWGHSSYDEAINNAHKSGVKNLVLFHHDPNRTDDQLIELEEKYQSRLRGRTNLSVQMAREGLVLEA
jgi:ribonuclease BN (tRNA processing enzyme)